MIIECKWKENVYQNRENYIRIEDAFKKIYDNQLEKHQAYLERHINRLNELFDNQIDFTKEGKVDTMYLFEKNSLNEQLLLTDVFSEIREMQSNFVFVKWHF